MARIEGLLVSHLERRYRGEDVSDETLIDDHPDLMPELGDQLQRLRDLPHPSAEKHGAAVDKIPLTSLTSIPGRILKARCPHCRESISMSVQKPFANITCEACGSRISLTEDRWSVQDNTGARQFAHFELVERVGRGAFGTVWKAHDKHLDRVVAVKIPCSSRLDIHETEKFLREARAAAQLNHPNIVSVHEVGREGETVYIVSDLVQGMPLSDWMIGHGASFREAAEVCAKIADALEHAHQAGVIHRDLKPQNILLDDESEPHVTDFGLARRETGEMTITQDGHILGTPAYMSPEQARGEAHTADSRSDVYSVGVILYELLTEEVPFHGTPHMLLHHVLHDEPRSPRCLNDRIPRDLETICLKAMAKEPRHRFATACQLANDLRRFLRDEPIHAQPSSSLTKGWRWCRRNPAVASLGAGVAGLLLLLAIAGPIVALGQASARREAEEARQEAEMNRAHVQVLAERDRRRLYVQDMNAALQAWKDADIARMVDLLQRHVPQVDQEEDLRSFIWYHLWRKCHEALTGPQLKFSETVSSLAFSPNGRWMAVGCGQSVRIYKAAARHRKPPIRQLSAEGTAMSLAFSPDSSWLAIGDADALTLWDHKTRRLLWKNKDLPEVESMAFTGDGKQLVASSGPVHRLDATTGRRLSHDLNVPPRFPPAAGARAVAISPGSARLATADWGGGSTIFKKNSGQQLNSIQAHTGHATSVAFSPDGTLLATTGNDATLRLWDASTYESVADLKGHNSPLLDAAFSTDGKWLATCGSDCTVRLWTVGGGQQLERTFRGHTKRVRHVAFSPDSTYLVSSSEDRTLRFWDLRAETEPATLRGHDYSVSQAVLFPDQRTLASASFFRDVRLWNLDTLTQISKHKCEAACVGVTLAPDGETLIVEGGNAEIWDARRRKLVGELSVRAKDCVFSPDGNLLASGGEGKVTLWDTSSWEVLHTIAGYGGRFTGGLAFSPDGQHLTVPNRRTVTVWRVADPLRPAREFSFRVPSDNRTATATITVESEGENSVTSAAFSHDGTKLATGTFYGGVQLWDAETGKSLGGSAYTGSVCGLAFSPDDKTLVVSDLTNDIKLWNVSAQEQIARLEGHEGPIWSASFSSDQQMLISTSFDTTIKIWKAASKSDVAATRPLSELLFDD